MDRSMLAILQLGPRKSDSDLINTACKDIIEGRFEKAIKELEESLRINPADKLAASNLEIAYNNYAGKRTRTRTMQKRLQFWSTCRPC
jgi:tetratricopeptide (TPR) repeat protein